MTSSVIKKYVLAALCGAAIVGVGQTAQAATWDIVGGSPAGAPNYGNLPNQNNVLNQGVLGNAHVFDTLNGASIIAGAQLQATFITAYDVVWTYVGSESDNTLRFSGPGVAGFDENNANNNCVGCNLVSPQPGPVVMGSATNQTAAQPVFGFQDQNDLSFVNNGSNPLPAGPMDPQPGPPNFLMSYAEFRNGAFGLGWYLTSSVTNIVVIGLNDSGFADDNHDDFTLVAFMQESGNENNTPIPGALPLFASVLGGGFLFRRLRNRRQAKAAA
jgi:hypothetical protein